jgi:hypothetical protein
MKEDINHKFCRYEEDNWLSPECMQSLFDNFSKAWKARREIDFQLRNSSIFRNSKMGKRTVQPLIPPEGGNKRPRVTRSEQAIGNSSMSDSGYSGNSLELPMESPATARPEFQSTPVQQETVSRCETPQTESRLELFRRLYEQRQTPTTTNADAPL